MSQTSDTLRRGSMPRRLACPKCIGGSLFPELHIGVVVEVVCLQCGRTLSNDEKQKLVEILNGK